MVIDQNEQQELMRERLAPLFARLPEGHGPTYIGIGPGWYDLVLDLDQRLAEIDPDYEILEVKEKFGLRYYARTSTTIEHEGSILNHPFWAPIFEAEDRSTTICEDCGGNASRAHNSAIILCDACEAARTDAWRNR